MRVVGGTHKGRPLKRPKGSRTRPTTDRVREAAASVLEARGLVSGAKVLDLFAGSGAMGIELLSRGASSAVFVEMDRSAVSVIQANLASLSLTGKVVQMDLRKPGAVEKLRSLSPFDLVLADPPYEISSALAEVAMIMGALAPGGMLLFEHATRTPPPVPSGLAITRSYEYGDSSLLLATVSE